jgi:hypothetical protein
MYKRQAVSFIMGGDHSIFRKASNAELMAAMPRDGPASPRPHQKDFTDESAAGRQSLQATQQLPQLAIIGHAAAVQLMEIPTLRGRRAPREYSLRHFPIIPAATMEPESRARLNRVAAVRLTEQQLNPVSVQFGNSNRATTGHLMKLRPAAAAMQLGSPNC